MDNIEEYYDEVGQEPMEQQADFQEYPFDMAGPYQGEEINTGDEVKAVSFEEKAEADKRSVFISQVDYDCSVEELQELFAKCGVINRVTIKSDATGNPKGFAFIEFDNFESVAEALKLDGQLLHGRTIRVMCKRTNVPGMKARRGGRSGPPGRGYGRGRGYGWYYPGGGPPSGRGRGRGRGGPYYAPF